jgi:hypothetical protein
MTRFTSCAFSWPKPLRGLAVLLAALLLALPLRAQPGDIEKAMNPPPFGEQTHVLRRLLFEMGFEPVEKIESVNPAETVVVILGDTSRVTKLPGGSTSAFLNRGGAMLLASDKGPLMRPFFDDVRVLTGYTLLPFHYRYNRPNRAGVCYQGEDFCPFLQPVPNAKPNLFQNPNDQGRPTLKVATNLPGALDRAVLPPPNPFPPGTNDLARLPRGCITTPEGEELELRQFHSCLISTETDKGRLLLIADHSIFINMMMLPDDNGNVEFASNCLNWLSEDGKRKKVLFIDDGDIQSKLDVPIKPDPFKLPPVAENEVLKGLDQAIAEANPALMRAESSDFFNRLINHWLTHGNSSPWPTVGLLFVLLTLVALVAGFFRLIFHGVQNQNPPAPSLARLVEHQEPTDSLMEQRNRGMMQVKNLWEVGRQLARQTFTAAGIAAKPGDGLPAVQLQGGWWARRKLRRKVQFLWALAFGKKPLPVLPAQWPGLLRQLDQLRRDLASGAVRFG